MRNCERVIREKRMRNWVNCETQSAKWPLAVYVNEQQTEDMKDRTTVLVAKFLFFALCSGLTDYSLYHA